MASWTPARGAAPALARLASASRAVALRPSAQLQQRRWAQVHDVRFLATTGRRRAAIVDRYREKLERRAREEGVEGGVEALREAYADRIRELRRRDAVAPVTPGTKGKDEASRQEKLQTASRHKDNGGGAASEQASQQAAADPSTAATGVKPLSAILDLDKARKLPADKLAAVWRMHHAGPGSERTLCAAIPAATYAAMEAAARRNPQFVLPVPHEGQGAEMHFLQWTFATPPTTAAAAAAADSTSTTSTVLFTQLAEYKTRGEYAVPHTTLTHHTDLAADTGLVLMHGLVAADRGVAVEHAQWLAMCLQRFYGGLVGLAEGDAAARERADERRRLVEWFAAGDQRFSVEKLMDEAERLA